MAAMLRLERPKRDSPTLSNDELPTATSKYARLPSRCHHITPGTVPESATATHLSTATNTATRNPAPASNTTSTSSPPPRSPTPKTTPPNTSTRSN